MISTSVRAAAAAFALLLLAHGAAAEAPPAPWVRKIELRGVKQLGRSVLRDRIELKTWRVLPVDPAVTVPAQVVEAYTRAGLPAPKVSVTVGKPDAKGAVHVALDVVETPLPRLETFDVDLDGLPFFTSLATRGKVLYFKLDAKLSRFNRKDLDSGLKKEQRRLRGLGWKGATFQVVEAPPEGDGARSVAVTLELGPRESLEGKGIDRPVMREVTASWKRRNVPLSEGVVNRLARAASTGMAERGYVDVVVTPSEQQDAKKKAVVLTASHGLRLAVEAIRFEGAVSILRKELMKALPLHEPQLFGLSKSHPGPEILEESRLALVDLYSRSGFPEATVEAATEGSGDRRTVVFRVNEGPRRTIGSLTFPGASVIGAGELRRVAKLEEGKPYVPSRDAEAAAEIRKVYSRRGYDEATVTPRPGAPDEKGRVPLAFEIAEGTAYRLGAVTVRGNTKTTTRKILSIGDERPGKPLDSIQLAEHQSHLSRLGVFDTVSVTSAPVPGSSPAEKSVLVDVVERSTRYVEYGFDINTQRGLELAGTVGERNLFGNATNGAFSALVGKERQSLVLEIGQPALFGTRLFGTVKGTYTWDTTYDGFSLQTTGVQAGFSWEYDRKHIVTLVYKLEEQLPLHIQPDVEEELVPVRERIGSLTPSVSLDQRDDPFLTTTGTYFLVRDKVSRRFLGGDADFDRLEGDSRYFRSLGSAIVAAGALRFGYAQAHGGTTLPVGERFYVGGASTHRGFKEMQLGPKGDDGSSLGGESYLLANVELRAPLLGPVEGGLFLDVGNAWLGRIDVTDLRWAAGAGLRLKTPVGPLRIDAGYLIDKREGESRTVFHVALGHAF
ncbi:MAG: BamA/TamA family outer membrane protein [Holophagales bacterium]|nr:BamA/TamA family outer membrane protein [Holophagales bacterium]